MLRLAVCAVLAAALTTPRADQGNSSSRTARIVLVSIDGGSDAMLDRLLASGALHGGGFEEIAARGLVAASMTPASVSSTPVSHPTLFTGAWPERHGITGEDLPGDALNADVRSGFSVATSVDPLWAIAQRAGKRVVCLMAPGAEATRPSNTCSETAPYASIGRAQSFGARDGATDLVLRLRRTIGPSPGEPDGRRATRGEITEADYVASSQRFADYLDAAVRHELRRADWDLLISYVPVIDNLEHRYLLTDPRQAEYSDESGVRRARFARYVDDAYKKVDRIIGGWLAAAPEARFLIVSDHGMIPTHSTVLLNNVLDAAGLRVEGPDPEVRAIASGGSAQVYVNARRRFARGTVGDAAADGIVRRIMEACRALRDPRTGTPIFSMVASRAEFTRLHLNHPNAGDVYISAASGWAVTDRFDAATPAIVPDTSSPDTRIRISRTPSEEQYLMNGRINELSLGIHGHLPADPRLQAWFMAAGPGVPHRRTGTIDMVDVAPTTLKLLGVAIPASMQGRPVW